MFVEAFAPLGRGTQGLVIFAEQAYDPRRLVCCCWCGISWDRNGNIFRHWVP